MRLTELLERIEGAELLGGATRMAADGVEITGVSRDHRDVKPGHLFVCVQGFTVDGHNFIPGALANGAVAIVVQREPSELPPVPAGVCLVRAPNTRAALADAACAFYGDPSRAFALVGITGTKGKTTTNYMLDAIARAAGLRAGLAGTIANRVGGVWEKAKETTPESLELQRLFRRMADDGETFVSMEASSQGLMLDRVRGADFDVGVFTNLYEDHISPREHGDMEEYFAAKRQLFSMCRAAVVNADSPVAGRVLSAARDAGMTEYDPAAPKHEKPGGVEVATGWLTFGLGEGARVRATRIEPLRAKNSISMRFALESPWYGGKFTVPFPGEHNVSNALAAIAAAGLCGIPEEAVREGLASASVKGRTEWIDEGQDFTVMVDFAHNAISLETLLTMLRGFGYKDITTVFGCGGDRPKDRRYGMGEASGKHSDFSVITSDNPRSEDPEAIMADVESRLRPTGGRYVKIADRKEAIRYALGAAKPGALVIIAGKGHETTQTFRDRTVHFDDSEAAREALRELMQKKKSGKGL